MACPPDEPTFNEMCEINYTAAAELVENCLVDSAKETYAAMDQQAKRKAKKSRRQAPNSGNPRYPAKYETMQPRDTDQLSGEA